MYNNIRKKLLAIYIFRDIPWTLFGHYFQEKSQENIKDNKESRLKSVDIQGFTEFAKNRNKSGDFFKSRHSDHLKEG